MRTTVAVTDSYGFMPGMMVTIGGEPKPRTFWARLWWYARTNVGGPRLFISPRRSAEVARIEGVSSVSLVLSVPPPIASSVLNLPRK